MTVTTYDYTVYKKGNEICRVVSIFLYGMEHSDPSDSLRKFLQSSFRYLTSDHKYERYLRFIKKYNDENTATPLKTVDTEIVNLVMAVFHELFSNKDAKLFDKFVNTTNSSDEQFTAFLDEGRSIIKKMDSYGANPIFYVEKNYVFLFPNAYKTNPDFPSFIKNLYLREKVEEKCPSANTIFNVSK